MRLRFLLWILFAVLAVAGYRCLLLVDETEMVIVTDFGRPVDAYRLVGLEVSQDEPWLIGTWEKYEPRDSGLHFKWPWQSTIRIDRRMQIYDPRPSEFLAAEKKNVDLDVYVCWRVEDPQRFLETVNDSLGAEARLHDIVWSQLAAVVGSYPIESLVSNDPDKHQLDKIQHDVAAACAEQAAKSYGITVVDVRLKRIGVPAQVRESVFQRMRAERGRIARQYRAEGEKEAQKIRAAADKEKTIKLAQADADAQRIRGKAEAEATRTYADAHGKDPEFYELMRTLEAYKRFLDDQTTILLSGDSDLLKFLIRPTAATRVEEPKAVAEPEPPVKE